MLKNGYTPYIKCGYTQCVYLDSYNLSKRAAYFVIRDFGDMGVALGCFDGVMPQQLLNMTNIDAVF